MVKLKVYKLRENIEKLEHFNDTAEVLNKESLLVRWLIKHKEKIHFSRQGKCFEFKLPYKDYIRAFTVTYRQFFLRKESIFLENMDDLYKKLPIDKKTKDKYGNIRKDLNEFLSSQIRIDSGRNTLTHEELINNILYGYIIHQTKREKRKYQKLEEDYFKDFYWGEFLTGIYTAYKYLVKIQDINKDAINELRNQYKSI